jgi:acyl carrier protein
MIIKNRIKKVIIHDLELNLHEDDIQNIKKLDELFGMDSVAIIELVIGLEKEFGIKIQPEHLNLENFKDLDTLSDFINSLIHMEKG